MLNQFLKFFAVMNYQSNQGINIFGAQPKVLPPPPPPSQPTVMFLKFSQLPFINSKEMSDKVAKLNSNIINTTDWKKVHQAIDLLRSFNKSFPESTAQIVEGYGTHILKFLQCTKKEIVKNTIALIQEIFMNCRIATLHSSMINILVNSVLQIVENTNKLSVKDCLLSLAANCITNETLIISCNIAVQNHTSIIGLRMIGKFLENVGQQFTNLDQNSLLTLMRCIQMSQLSQEVEIVSLTNQIAMFIYNTIGDNFFQMLLNSTLSDYERPIFIQNLQYAYVQQPQQAAGQPIAPKYEQKNSYQQDQNQQYNYQ